MRSVELVACGALLALLAGCDYVSSTHPVGEAPLALEEADWKGVWMQSDGPLTVRVADAENGILEIGWIEEEDGELALETATVHLRTFSDWTFASFPDVEDVRGVLFSRLERDERRVILWWPRAEEVARLVAQGLLPGRLEEDNVLLERLGPEHLAILVGEEHGMLYQWDEPMTFWRLR